MSREAFRGRAAGRLGEEKVGCDGLGSLHHALPKELAEHAKSVSSVTGTAGDSKAVAARGTVGRVRGIGHRGRRDMGSAVRGREG